MVFQAEPYIKNMSITSGPGDYELNNTDISSHLYNSKNFHKNYPPFNSSEERSKQQKKDNIEQLLLYTTNSISNSQGLFNENKYIKKTFNNFLNDKNNTEISFLSGQNRFKNRNINNEKDIEEFKEKYLNSLNPKEDYNLQKKYKIKNQDKLFTGSLIPHKLKKIKNSRKYNLGPGEYDINPKWSKNIIKWSNLTEQRFQPIKTDNVNTLDDKEKIELNIYNTNQKKINQKLINNVKNMKNELFKSLQNKRKNLFDFYKEELYTKTTDNVSPGFRNYNDTFLPHKFFKQQRYQYFGSTSPRFPNEGNKNNLKSYLTFNNKNFDNLSKNISSTNSNNYKHIKGVSFSKNPHKNKETYINKPGINGLVISNIENHCEINNNKNNSSYESDIYNNQIYSQFNKAMKLDDKCFNSQEVRFKYNNEDNNLGPGEYFNDEYINEKKQFCILNKQKLKNNHISNNDVTDNFLINNIESPGVGTYNINNYSIENNLNKIKKKYRNNKISFNSNKIRFNYKIKDEDKILGPGYYDINIKDNIKNVKIMPEHVNINIEKKFDDLQKQNMGPGRYKSDSYFDWNYKSYNKKFN